LPADEIGSDAAAPGAENARPVRVRKADKENTGKIKNGGIVIMAVLPFG